MRGPCMGGRPPKPRDLRGNEAAAIDIVVRVRGKQFNVTRTDEGFIWLEDVAWPHEERWAVSKAGLERLVHDHLHGLPGKIILRSSWPPLKGNDTTGSDED